MKTLNKTSIILQLSMYILYDKAHQNKEGWNVDDHFLNDAAPACGKPGCVKL